MKIWSCKIGECDAALLPEGADAPMRAAVGRAYREVTGVDAAFNFSGWGAELEEPERAVVEKREPSEEYYRDWLKREAAPDLYEALKDASAVIEMMLRIAPDATATFGEANGIQLARAKAAAALSKVSQQQGKEK